MCFTSILSIIFNFLIDKWLKRLCFDQIYCSYHLVEENLYCSVIDYFWNERLPWISAPLWEPKIKWAPRALTRISTVGSLESIWFVVFSLISPPLNWKGRRVENFEYLWVIIIHCLFHCILFPIFDLISAPAHA